MASRVKVLFVSRKMNFAGAVRVLWDIIKYIDRDQFDVNLIIDGDSGSAAPMLLDLGVKIEYLEKKIERTFLRGRIKYSSNRSSRKKSYLDLLDNLDPDLIYFNTNGNLDLLEWSANARAKIICHLHGVGEGLINQGYNRDGTQKDISKKRRSLTKLIPHHYVACSKACAKVLQLHYDISETNMSVFPESLDPFGINASTHRVKSIRRQYNLAEQDTLVVCVGNFHYRKGPDILFKAFLKAKQELPELRLMWVGDMAEDIKQYHYLKDIAPQIDELISSGGLIVTGHQQDVYDYLGAGDIFALCSRDECLPLSILEAMSLQVPVVATDVGGVSEAVIDRVTGRLLPTEDIDAIANALIELARDKEAGRVLAERANEKVKLIYNSKDYINQLEGIMLSLAGLNLSKASVTN